MDRIIQHISQLVIQAGLWRQTHRSPEGNGSEV